MFAARVDRVRAAMAAQGIDVLLLSVGADLPWLTGYEAMPLERLTMLVLPRDGEATLVVPALEAPRVVERPEVFAVRPWGETEDPIELVSALIGPAEHAVVGDRTWARFVLALQQARPTVCFTSAAELVGPLRAVKDTAEVEALRRAAGAVDSVIASIQHGDVPLVGRTEADVAAEVGRRLLDAGHRKVNFVIVASGPNAASPHHEPGARTIEHGEVVLFDIGGTWTAGEHDVAYCSDITRCVHLGEPPTDVAHAYRALFDAQQAASAAATVGTPCEAVDAVARDRLGAAGLGESFVHRTGHGIGVEEHEDPYLVAGNATPLVAGHAFSIEPGVYLPGRFGLRLEDIVVAAADGPDVLNTARRDLVVLDR